MMNGRRELLRALDAWRRGFSDAPLVCKWTAQPALQPLAHAERGNAPPAGGRPASRHFPPAERQLAARDWEGKGYPATASTVVASTGDVDRHGDIVAPDGWRLDAYRANPVVLWAHDYRQPAIGRAPAVWTEGRALLADIEFAPTDFGRTVASLYREGYQRGVSVGFRPLRFEERRDARSGAFLGIRFLEQELLEISAVPVPANGNALLRAEGEPALRRQLDPSDAAASVVSLLRGLRR